jgi:hypothetical protein
MFKVITFPSDNFWSRDATKAAGEYNTRQKNESIKRHHLLHTVKYTAMDDRITNK